MTTLTILETILRAKNRQELFGTGSESKKKATYNKLARQSHPDMFSHPTEKDLATKAFVHLTTLWESSTTQTAHNTQTSYVQTKKNRYTFEDKFYEDDVFVAYKAKYDDGHENSEIWVVKSPHDNDLATTAAQTLKKLSKDVPEEFRGFFPNFIEMFRYRQDNIDRTAVSYHVPEGFYSIREVLEAYPEGINGRDVAWMFKRMLVTIGNTYDAGIVHGGISKDSFLVHPEKHGIILRNWQYSVEDGNALTVIDSRNKENYPASVFDKKPQSYNLDVYMVSKLALELLDDKAPNKLRLFFKGCQLASLPHPANLLAEFDDLLRRVYGPPKFHEFAMPTS